MAEFALGLTKTAVEGTLSRVRSAIEEERKLKVRVQNDLVFITGEFEMMQSFLNVANAAERAQNQVVRTWVRQLRDLAFDVEDCVEFVIHLDKTSAWTSWFWRALPSCIASELPLDVAIAEIEQLKARVVDVSDRNTRYNLIGTNSDSNATSKLVSSPAPELMLVPRHEALAVSDPTQTLHLSGCNIGLLPLGGGGDTLFHSLSSLRLERCDSSMQDLGAFIRAAPSLGSLHVETRKPRLLLWR